MLGNKSNTVGHGISYFLLGEGTREGGSLSLMTADVNRPVVLRWWFPYTRNARLRMVKACPSHLPSLKSCTGAFASGLCPAIRLLRSPILTIVIRRWLQPEL